ncbi:hypothetical protein PENSPDRAFT_758563 [Peniophora sp. CONT]|nr:hypothetical protein PENSPDRAFT_758563 [Peniophora sp. CONT]
MSTPPASSDQNPVLNDFGQLWHDALERYEQETGKNLLEEPLASDFPSISNNTDTIMTCFEKQIESFKAFRTRGKKVLNVLRPIVDVVLLIKDCADGASDAIPGGDVMFGAIGVLLQTTKGVSRLYDAIEALFQAIKNYLERISTHLKPSTPPSHALMNILVDTLVHIFTAIALTTKYCDRIAVKKSSRFELGAFIRRIKDYFLVLADKTDVKEVLEKIRELAAKELQVVAADTEAIVREIQRQAVDEDVDRIHKWLDPPNPQPRNYESKRQAGSCNWFFDDTFEGWKARNGGMFWVSGHAGAGKSVICSSVVDALRKDPDMLLAYFYFDEGDDKKKDHRGLVSSLIFQIGISSERNLDHLRKQHSSHSPTYDILLPLLSQLLKLSGRTVIVIDALDECPERARDSDKGLLRFFLDLRDLWSRDDIDLRVLATSRLENDIRECMPALITHSLNVNEAREHTDDIRNYISNQLFAGRESKAYSGWPESIKWSVYNTLIEMSNGMFLWVVLQLQDLKHCAAGGVKRALKELPSTLDETYERILKHFPSKPALIAPAHHIFECVAFASHPLSPPEVAEILSMDFDSPTPWKALTFDVRDEDPETTILRTCPRLLEIVSDNNGRKIVQFIHLSVKEYLTSETLRRATSSPAHPYSFDESSARLTLGNICLSTLVVNSPTSALRAYADAHWDDYVSPRDVGSLVELLDSFLHMDSESPSLARWEGRPNHNIEIGFHWAAAFGYYHRAERMLERSRQSTSDDGFVRIRDSYGRTALHHAAFRGNVDVCRLLLKHGALAEDTDNDGGTPLHDAARTRNLDTGRLLLEHPAADGSNVAARRCRMRNIEGQTALHEAAHWGQCAEVCQLLLEHGALVDDMDEYGKTPLQYAKEAERWDVIDVLSKHDRSSASVSPH